MAFLIILILEFSIFYNKHAYTLIEPFELYNLKLINEEKRLKIGKGKTKN